MEGILIFNHYLNRPDISAQGELWGGLQCGSCFEVLLRGEWTPVRLEYEDDWVIITATGKSAVPYSSKTRT